MQYNRAQFNKGKTMIPFLAVLGVSIIAIFTVEFLGIENHPMKSDE